MCGIYGHLQSCENNDNDSISICLKGLRKLEYRGYDSAGIAGIINGEIISLKSVGKIEELSNKLKNNKLQLNMAIAHTRWATHGGITEKNAHPHYDQSLTTAVVHNGIIENYQTIKSKLIDQGIKFVSETDTEVVSQLIATLYNGDLLKTVKTVISQLEGSFALAIIHKNHPNTIITTTSSSPLAISMSRNKKEIFISSDINAFDNSCIDIHCLHDGEIALLTPSNMSIYDNKLTKIVKTPSNIYLNSAATSKNGFDHFLLKEIHDQPDVLRKILKSYCDTKTNDVNFGDDFSLDERLKTINNISIVACGSSYHAGYIIAPLFKNNIKIQTHVEMASEFRYSNPVINKNTLVIAVSQSGETADTLAAIREAKKFNPLIVAICNVKNSSLSKEADLTIWQNAGPEISVCSTKTFTSQLCILMLLACKMMNQKDKKSFIANIVKIPYIIEEVLKQTYIIKKYATKYSIFNNCFFIGRQYMYGASLEAALKLKEISYINATGYPAGELKHGPLALIDSNTITIALCGNETTIKKLISNLMEIKARNGQILAFTPDKYKHMLKDITEDIVIIPDDLPDEFTPFSYSVATQLFAYHVANSLNKEIDQPRNLAKSVTVE